MLNKNVLISTLTLLSKTSVLHVYMGGRGKWGVENCYSAILLSPYNVIWTNNQITQETNQENLDVFIEIVKIHRNWITTIYPQY